jgi:hypothetical protein
MTFSSSFNQRYSQSRKGFTLNFRWSSVSLRSRIVSHLQLMSLPKSGAWKSTWRSITIKSLISCREAIRNESSTTSSSSSSSLVRFTFKVEGVYTDFVFAEEKQLSSFYIVWSNVTTNNLREVPWDSPVFDIPLLFFSTTSKREMKPVTPSNCQIKCRWMRLRVFISRVSKYCWRTARECQTI